MHYEHVSGPIPIEADGWESHYLPPDTDQATVAEVKAALDLAMQVEIKSEKPSWHLGKILLVAIQCLVFLLGKLGARII